MVVNYKHENVREALYKLLDVVDCMQFTSDNRTTDKEKLMLTEFLLLDPERFGIYRFSRWAKDQVIKQAKEEIDWKLTNRNIANKVASLIDKGLLYREVDNQVYIKPWLLRASTSLVESFNKGERYDIKFRFNNNGAK
jgi:hypothetical protein